MDAQVCKITYIFMYLAELRSCIDINGKGRKPLSSLRHPKSKLFPAVSPTSNFSSRLQRIQNIRLTCLVENGDTPSPDYLRKKEQCFPKKQKTKPVGKRGWDSWVVNTDITNAWIMYRFRVKENFHLSHTNSPWCALLHIYISELKVIYEL